MYTLTQVERHRACTTKFSKAWGDLGWSPTRWIHWCLAHSTFFCSFTGGRLVCRGSMIHFSMIVSMVFLKCA